MGGGGSTTQTTVQELSPEQRKLLEPVIPIATDFVKNPPQQFPGTGIANYNPLQQQAQQMTLQAAQSMLPITQALPQQLSAIQQGFAGNINNVGNQANAGNAQLQQILAGINPAIQGQTDSTLQNLYGNFGNIASGAQQTGQGIGGALATGQQANQPGLNFLTSGQVFGSNPYLQAATDAAIRPYLQRLQQQVMPSIASQAVSTGGYGGTRQGIAEGLAAQEFARQAGDITTNMANNAYNQGLNAFQQGLGLQQNQTAQQIQGILGAGGLQNQAAQQIMQGILSGGQLQQSGTLGGLAQLIQGQLGGQQLQQGAAQLQQQGLGAMAGTLGQTGNFLQQGLLPAQLVASVGEQQQAGEQAYLSEQVQKYINEQLIPFSAAQDVAAMAFGIPAGTTRTTTTGGNTGGGMQAAQMGLGVLGLLMGLSDRRRKTNIRRVGRRPDGLNVYRYRLIGDVIDQTGLMADEVKKLYPTAVIRMPDGYDRVNYFAVPNWYGKAV